MKRSIMKTAIMLTVLCALLISLTATPAAAKTEQEKQAAIDAGLAYLASPASGIQSNATEAWWPYGNDGTLAATASATLAFVEEGYLPGDPTYGDLVDKTLNYIFNRAVKENDVNQFGLFFDPSFYKRDVYTNGIVSPLLYALGTAYGPDTVIGRGNANVIGLTYRQTMQELVWWFCWGQNADGGWRYTPNYGASDNSTAQWGALPLLYADAWGLDITDKSGQHADVLAALENWVNYIQCDVAGPMYGGSGYDTPTYLVNVAKTGGLLIELKAIGAPKSDQRVQDALAYINNNWNTTANDTWDGNLGHPYGMWAVYKGLDVYGLLNEYPSEDFLVGSGMPAAPGGLTIGQDWDTKTSAAGDWYSHYCEWIVNNQNADGSWPGYSYWLGALANGWYINILNAVGVPPTPEEKVPGFTTLGIIAAASAIGIAGILILRRRKAIVEV